ncbi:MAG: Uma2 family endonuclease, partial [Chloroflexota bacterium]
MEREQIRYTVADYLEIVALPENENKRLELIDGIIEEMAPSRKKNTEVALAIGAFIFMYVYQNDLGYASGADGGYQIDETTLLMPDVGFISKNRTSGKDDGVAYEVAPDLAVE